MRWIIAACVAAIIILVTLLVFMFPSGERRIADRPDPPATVERAPEPSPPPPTEQPAPAPAEPEPARTPEPAPEPAGFRLSLPVACEPGVDCFMQHYVDTDASTGVADFACGPHAYDGHKGTDFRLRDRQAMRDGVAVLAAADGTILGSRDGLPDRPVSEHGGRAALNGQDCGNGIRIDHGGGWTAQYCHLRFGSVKVRAGQAITRGDELGLIGMSGAADFPHLHLTLRKDGEVIDPYRGVAPEWSCGGSYETLWDAETEPKVAYRAGGMLTIGMHGNPQMTYEDIKEGRGSPPEIAADAPVLVAWAFIYGIHRGDVLKTRITGPDGQTVFESQADPHPKYQAQVWKWSGKRNRTGLQPGLYRARLELLRDGAVHDAWETETLVR